MPSPVVPVTVAAVIEVAPVSGAIEKDAMIGSGECAIASVDSDTSGSVITDNGENCVVVCVWVAVTWDIDGCWSIGISDIDGDLIDIGEDRLREGVLLKYS